MPEHKKPYGLGQAKPARSRAALWCYLVFVSFLALGAMSFATQRVAAYYGFHPALGAPLGRAMDLAWYAPWSIFAWQAMPGLADSHGYVEQSLSFAQALFILPQFLVLSLFVGRRTLSKGCEDLHGSARWARLAEIRAMGLLDGQGVYVGGWLQEHRGGERLRRALRGQPLRVQRYLRHNGPEHVLCFAPTRSGKGVGLIIPTLLAWRDSTVVFDIKGENWNFTAGWLAAQGHRVLRFDPSDASGNSAFFNPLEEIRLETVHAVQDAQNLVSMILDPQGKGLSDYWHKAAFGFLSGALLHCLVVTRHAEGRAATLFDLSCLLADEKRPIQDVFEEMIATDHAAMLDGLLPAGVTGRHGADIHRFVTAAAREMLNKADRELSGVLSTAVANLNLYRDPVVAMNTARCDFRLADLARPERPVNLYLVISPADIDRLRPLVRIVLTMLLNRATARLNCDAAQHRRVLLMLDEFTALGKLDIVERAVAYMAGYGLKGYFIVQDIVQLNAVYGKDNGLMANCHVRVAFAPNTVETARVLSAMTGKATVIEKKTALSGARSGGLKNASLSVNEVARPLLTEDECMRLPGPTKDATGRITAPGDMLVFCAGQPPIYGKQILYFLDPVFSQRARIAAPGKSDSLHPERTRPGSSDKPQPKPSEDKPYERYLAEV